MAELARRPRGSLFGWPLALGAGASGLLVWTLQTLTGASRGELPLPERDAGFAAAFGFWLHTGWYALPLVLTVLFLSLLGGAVLSGMVLFGPQPFESLLRRVHELGAALPPLLLLMLWHMGERAPSRIGFIAVVSAVFSVEIANLLAETGKRLERNVHVAGETLGTRWQRFLRNSVQELRSQLAIQAALVAGSVFALEAALSFIGLHVPGMPTWGSAIGDAARLGNVSPSAVVLALLGCLATVIGAYQLLSTRPAEGTPSRPAPALALDEAESEPFVADWGEGDAKEDTLDPGSEAARAPEEDGPTEEGSKSAD